MFIEVSGVVAGYGRTEVLRGVDWRIGPGVTGLLGPNGAGKTTLLHLITGITRPRRGVVRAVTGGVSTESTDPAYGKRIGFLPQHFTFAAEMRVADTVSYAAWVNGLPREQCAAAAERALTQVDLVDRSQDRVKTLSGGQRQRLGVATALAHGPDLLVLDEPTVGLDPSQRLRLREVIAELSSFRPVVVSTHLVEDVTHLCSRVGILANGTMAFDDDIHHLSALVGQTQSAGRLGSPFEQAYAGIIARPSSTSASTSRGRRRPSSAPTSAGGSPRPIASSPGRDSPATGCVTSQGIFCR
ncbi:ATP-binding cassette domain-containing protein [Actinoplanes sp. CA-054009]